MCQSSADVEREQEKIMEELETDYRDARSQGIFQVLFAATLLTEL
jgi:hypothetical protein